MTTLHPDFADLRAEPGESHITGEHERFALINVAAFGGAADRPSHVPEELGRLGSTIFWESTGSSDALPFWNTNFHADAWLYLVHGSVRVEFKYPESDRRLGHQLCRTGDLFRLPKDIAHRTFSGDGKRRISIELLEQSPHIALTGTREITPDPGGRIGDFRFTVIGDEVRISTPTGELVEPRHYFGRAVRALVAHELHLEHNEFLGGFVVHDHGAEVTLKAAGHAERLPGGAVLDVFAGLLPRLG